MYSISNIYYCACMIHMGIVGNRKGKCIHSEDSRKGNEYTRKKELLCTKACNYEYYTQDSIQPAELPW